jgi:hypothetical protein
MVSELLMGFQLTNNLLKEKAVLQILVKKQHYWVHVDA